MEMGGECGFMVGWMGVWGICVFGETVFTFKYKLFI